MSTITHPLSNVALVMTYVAAKSPFGRGAQTVAAVCLVLGLAAAPAQADLGEELAKLTASDAAANDRFGNSVALSGNTALVGAVNDDDDGSSSGSAYLFDVTTGEELFKLTASDAAAGAVFGDSVALSGNMALVGAFGNVVGGIESGSAYLFDVTTGDELFKLTASDAAEFDLFGDSVALSGNTALVGAWRDDDDGSSSGSAYLFDVTTGDELFKLTASDAEEDDRFGISVALSGNTALVGARQDDDDAIESGSAYLFDVTTGEELFKLTASDAGAFDQFGDSVALSGNTALVGAPGDDDNSGSAYLFDVTTGEELFKLTASDAAELDLFGDSVALSGNTALVGTVFGGSAYLFDVTTGEELFKLTASDAAPDDRFGTSVALSGNTALVGARFDDNDGGSNSGSAYLFRAVPEPATLVLAGLAAMGLVAARRRAVAVRTAQ